MRNRMDELEAEQWIHSRAERWRNESGADWAVTDASGLLGRVGLTHLDLAQGPSVKRPCTPTDGMTCTFTRAWPVTPDRTRAASRHVGAGAAIRGRQDHVIASILACALARAGPRPHARPRRTGASGGERNRLHSAVGSRSISIATVRIDHVIYGTADLDAAAALIEARLGLSTISGGRHDGVGTHNRIVPLGGGGFIELLAVFDQEEARRSPLGAALQAGIANGDGLIGWAVAVEDVGPVAGRLGAAITTVGRQGLTARLTGVSESRAEPGLPFFIERPAGRTARLRIPPVRNTEASISWLEVAGDADRLEQWLGDVHLPVRVVDGESGVCAIGIGDRELRTRSV